MLLLCMLLVGWMLILGALADGLYRLLTPRLSPPGHQEIEPPRHEDTKVLDSPIA